jgi:hypothetical protein
VNGASGLTEVQPTTGRVRAGRDWVVAPELTVGLRGDEVLGEGKLGTRTGANPEGDGAVALAGTALLAPAAADMLGSGAFPAPGGDHCETTTVEPVMVIVLLGPTLNVSSGIVKVVPGAYPVGFVT